MKQLPTDDDLRRAHEAFKADHERLRSELLTVLPGQAKISGRAAKAGHPSIWITASMSACVALAIVTWFVVCRWRLQSSAGLRTRRRAGSDVAGS